MKFIKSVCLLPSLCVCVVQDDSLLKGRIQLIEVAVNSVLGLEGDLESCVYFIASGRLRVYRLTGDQSKSQVHRIAYVCMIEHAVAISRGAYMNMYMCVQVCVSYIVATQSGLY